MSFSRQVSALTGPTRFRPWLVGSLVVVLLAVVEYIGVVDPLRAAGERGLQPFFQAGVAVVEWLRRPLEWARVATRKYSYVLDLELRSAEQVAQLSELNRLQRENQALRELLAVSTPAASRRLSRRLAPVLSYAQPTIGLGSADGVELNDLVVVRGVLVGKVMETSRHQARVRLLASFGESDVLLAQTEQGVSGLLTGDGQQVLLTELPITATIQVGQRVETLGQLGVFPALALGRVAALRRQEGAPTQTAVLDQGVSFYRETLVEVLE